jgi:hypothetical protein
MASGEMPAIWVSRMSTDRPLFCRAAASDAASAAAPSMIGENSTSALVFQKSTLQCVGPVMPRSAASAEKGRRADFVVDSSQGFDHTRAQIRDILRDVATMRRR